MVDDDNKAGPTKPGDPSSEPRRPADGGAVPSESTATGASRPNLAGPGTPSEALAKQPTSPLAGPAVRRGGPGTEWTASDDRGPLSRAEDAEYEESETPPTIASPIGTGSAKIDPAAANAIKASGGTDAAKTGAPGGFVPGQADAAKATDPTKIDASKSDTAKSDIAKSDPAKSKDHSPVAATKSAVSGGGAGSPRPSVTPSPAEPKRSLWPVAAALIIGAVIGAGSAAFVYRGYADDTQPDPKVVSLTTRVDALEKRPDPQASVAGLKSSVASLDAQVAAIRQGKAASAATPPSPGADPKASSPRAVASPQPADLAPLNQKVAALQSKLDALKPADTKTLEDRIGALAGELNKAKAAATAAQSGVSAVEGQQKEIASKVMAPALAVVADSLVQQIDRGQPYATQVEALAGLGADQAKIAVLRQNADKGVPSARVLGAKFEPLALPIIATANKAPPNAGLAERLKSGMLSIVSIRRVDDTSGDDLPSRVARIKAALAHDDVAAALDTWSKLPPDAKVKAEAWGALAKTHVEAMNAARALQQDAIVALGTKKS